ncbi:MAG: sigma-70 family RNA polymerase sigma factor, partial [Gemmatimonadetes bacterium]|nr:sigma-70 family RNA polymerase sigma factor [Gemmatimonadota bacterium]
MTTPTDGEVISRVLAGARDEYALLVERYQAPLYRHALGMVQDPDAAADLVQDSFVRGYQRLGSCDPARVGGWLFSILRNRCTDYLREHRRRDVTLDADAPFRSRDDPERDLERGRSREGIERALAALPEQQREAFLLKHVEGASYEEMAETLGVGISALKMRVARAREALRDALAEPGEAGSRERGDPGGGHPSSRKQGRRITEPNGRGIKMIRTMIVGLALLAAPLSLDAQGSGRADERIAAARARAAQAGIPVELIDSRIAEGRAKGVAEARIAEAVERRAAGLARAQEAMARGGSRPTTPELSAGGDAMEAGVDGQTLRAVVQAARAEDRPVALAVLAELVRQGVPVADARAQVEAALARRGDALARLPEQAAAARARRGPPATAGRPAGT